MKPFNPSTAAAVTHLAHRATYTKDAGGEPYEIVLKKFGEHHAEMMKRFGATAEDIRILKAELRDLEQLAVRAADAPRGGGTSSVGTLVAENPETKSFGAYRARPSRVSFDLKTTMTSGATSGGPVGSPSRDEAVLMPQRGLTVRDLLPTIRVTDGSVEFPRQTGRTNAAATVAEGALKPESGLAFELVSTPIRTIAHWIPASRQILDDAPQLAGVIDSELLRGLKFVEENQLLNGSGTGTDLSGLVQNATAFSPPITLPTPNMIDVLGIAILQNALANLPADGIIVNAADWMRMRLIKGDDGNYLLGNPSENTAKVLFGLRVVDTAAMAPGKFLVGAFQASATLYDRWEARVEISTEHSDFFTRNLVAILAEERIGLAVKQSAGLTYGDFADGIEAAAEA